MLNKKNLQYIFTRGTCTKRYANIFLKSHLSNVNFKKNITRVFSHHVGIIFLLFMGY